MTPMQMEDLHFTVDADGIAIIALDVADKPMNVITPALQHALREAVERVAGDAAIKGAVITSAKADFMAGADIKAMETMFDSLGADLGKVYREQSRPFSETLRRMETCGKPFAAALNGSALGGGLEVALACHYRVAADDPKLILSLPEVTIGLIPGAGGTQRLPRLIGIQKAVPLMLQGKRLAPREALALGVIHEAVAADHVLAQARSWVLEKGDPVQPWDRKDFAAPGGSDARVRSLAQFYNLTATQIANSTQHNNPAPITLLSVVARGMSCPMDAALRVESRGFTQVFTSPVARNMMRTLFVSRGKCEKLAGRPREVAPAQIRSVGIVGAGLMGAGIAQVSAQAGMDVIMLDASLAQAEAAKQKLAQAFRKQIEKGRMQPEQSESLLARIRPAGDYAALADCDLVVEAVFEDRGVKNEVFAKARAAMRADAILASNTSSLPISGLAKDHPHPERFIGLHFFSPVDRMALIEVVRGRKTSDQTLAHALDYVKRLRKTPIVVNDSHGFFTTRVIGSYINEAVGMLSEGISPALIDNAAKLAGFPIGPLALTDELTIELGYHASTQYKADLGDKWVEGHGYRVYEKFVIGLDRKGRRYGAGFYDYKDGKRVLWAGMKDVYPQIAESPSAQELGLRMLYIQALEAARAFEEGVITDPGEGDVGAVLGIGFPMHTGGPFALMDTAGLPGFVAACAKMARRHGPRYRPSRWLRARAAQGLAFYPKAAG